MRLYKDKTENVYFIEIPQVGVFRDAVQTFESTLTNYYSYKKLRLLLQLSDLTNIEASLSMGKFFPEPTISIWVYEINADVSIKTLYKLKKVLCV